MPNWCHNTLRVIGPNDLVTPFMEAVVGDIASDDEGGKQPVPLSFAKIVPEPTPEEYEHMEDVRKVTCYMCGGVGHRPVTKEEARQSGALWEDDWPSTPYLAEWFEKERAVAVAERRPCNVCDGTGRALPQGDSRPAWYDWRVHHWGTKWEPSFGDGPLFALGDEGASVDASVGVQGRYPFPGGVEYVFDTAWAPPVPVVAVASMCYPDLMFVLRWGEPGMESAGEVTALNGKLVEKTLPIEEVLTEEQMWF